MSTVDDWDRNKFPLERERGAAGPGPRPFEQVPSPAAPRTRVFYCFGGVTSMAWVPSRTTIIAVEKLR